MIRQRFQEVSDGVRGSQHNACPGVADHFGSLGVFTVADAENGPPARQVFEELSG